MARSNTPKTRLARLSAVLEGAKTMLIVVQNNPDPDALAAAAALREIANQMHGIACSVTHSGAVGRAENKALLDYLRLNTRDFESIDLERFDRIGMVDAQPGAGNVKFDPSVRLDVVIDHHPIRRETRSARFTDVRRRYGATCSMLYEYLTAAGIEISTRLATAMIYGIRSDTQDLGRESTKCDLDAYLALYPLANPRVLGRVLSAPLPHSYFSKLREALDSATVYGNRIVSDLGDLDSPEMVAEAADLLLRAENVCWTMCVGVIDGWFHLSLRTSERDGNAGRIARNLGGRRGFGGGHGTLAAAQIPIPNGRSKRDVRKMVNGLTKRFLKATGGIGEKGSPLCS